MKTRVKEKIREVDLKIAKNEENLKEVTKLLADIQKAKATGTEEQKKNAMLAEPLAQKSYLTAKETQKKLSTQRMELLMELERLNIEERRLKSDYETIISQKTVGVVKNCSGEVKVINVNDKSSAQCKIYSTFREGDMIITGRDGRAEIVFLEGRGKLKLEPDTSFIITKDDPSEEIFEFLKGKIHVQIENQKRYLEKLERIIDEYKEDLRTIKGWMEEKIGKEEQKRFYIWVCEFFHPGYVCTPSGPISPYATFGARGTEFICEADGSKLRLLVFQGEVEVTITKTNETLIIPKGTEALIEPSGRITQYRFR
ncbi:MAG: FecR family protein [Desulfobacterota bacterium]|nr:FecR family protein [Thermodesulfobacteriota bacterium]